MALFGEKYGDRVRVVSVGDWARELCGGTHAGRSGQLGVIKLLGEASIGSGVRRVEALVGGDAYRFLAREHVLVAQLSEALKVRPEQLPERVNDIVERLRAAEKEIEKVRVSSCCSPAPSSPRAPTRSVRSRSSRTARDGAAGGDVRRSRSTSGAGCPAGSPGVVVVIGVADGKVAVVAAVNDEARARGAVGQRAGARGRPAGRRQGRRQGRRGAGRRHRRVAGRRGARAASRPRSAGRSRLEVRRRPARARSR